jgi:hypothetical protein
MKLYYYIIDNTIYVKPEHRLNNVCVVLNYIIDNNNISYNKMLVNGHVEFTIDKSLINKQFRLSVIKNNRILYQKNILNVLKYDSILMKNITMINGCMCIFINWFYPFLKLNIFINGVYYDYTSYNNLILFNKIKENDIITFALYNKKNVLLTFRSICYKKNFFDVCNRLEYLQYGNNEFKLF